jgi:hypothetical protein
LVIVNAPNPSVRVRVGDVVAGAAATHEHSPAAVWTRATVTCDRLWPELVAFAGYLPGLGRQCADGATVGLETRPGAVVAPVSVPAAGGLIDPINLVLQPRRVTYILAGTDGRGDPIPLVVQT